MGQEVSAVGVGDRIALMLRQGHWVKVELVRVEDAGGDAEKRRSLFSVRPPVSKADNLLERLTPDKKDEAAAGTSGEEVRTLWVDFDEQGERYKRWRDVCNESYTAGLDEKPLEGPLTRHETYGETRR